MVRTWEEIDWGAEAELIGQRLRALSHEAMGGEAVVWLKPGSTQGSLSGKAITLGPHLYAGYSGVALFLAALGHVLDRGYGNLALRALVPLRKQLTFLVANPVAAEKLKFKIGGLVGLGAFIYSFIRIGLWLDEPRLIAEACEIATLITPERIEQDTSLDLMYGSAGAVLSLLLLDREAPATLRDKVSPLTRAIQCGEHLLRRSIVFDCSARGWPAHIQPLGSGFAHGASGIAYALAQLAERSQREDFRQAAKEGLAFERLCYSPVDRNWRSQRDSEQIRITAWCNGAPGVALGRLGIPWGEVDYSEKKDEIRIALETTRQAASASRDHVCCGNMGRAEILLQAFHRLGDGELFNGARELATDIVSRARKQGGIFRWAYHSDDQFSPAFFKGAAGIGYSLLRFSEVPFLPCVLALE